MRNDASVRVEPIVAAFESPVDFEFVVAAGVHTFYRLTVSRHINIPVFAVSADCLLICRRWVSTNGS